MFISCQAKYQQLTIYYRLSSIKLNVILVDKVKLNHHNPFITDAPHLHKFNFIHYFRPTTHQLSISDSRKKQHNKTFPHINPPQEVKNNSPPCRQIVPTAPIPGLRSWGTFTAERVSHRTYHQKNLRYTCTAGEKRDCCSRLSPEWASWHDERSRNASGTCRCDPQYPQTGSYR